MQLLRCSLALAVIFSLAAMVILPFIDVYLVIFPAVAAKVGKKEFEP